MTKKTSGLPLPQQVSAGTVLATVASEANIMPAAILMELGVAPAEVDLQGAPIDVWQRLVRTVHAGKSASAGHGADAVACLVEKVAERVRGNSELATLAHALGNRSVRQAGHTAVFLSYSRRDVSTVDRLYEALVRAAPAARLFQDHRSISLGQDWLHVLRTAAGTASHFVCWITAAYLDSPFCNYEVGIAESLGASIIPAYAEATVAERAPAYLTRPQAVMAYGIVTVEDVAATIARNLGSL